jgi:hypothetical protein
MEKELGIHIKLKLTNKRGWKQISSARSPK